MNQIQDFKVLEDKLIRLQFNDGSKKVIDFKPYIKDNPLTSPLKDPNYFRKVQLYENGRGLYWPNGYDFCPDYLHDFVEGGILAKA